MSDVAAKSGKVISPKPFNRFKASLQERAAETQKDKNRGSEIVQDQANKILTAQTLEEVWEADEGGTVSGKNFTDIPMQILSYDLAPSSDEYESDLDVYVNMRVVVLESGNGYSPGDEVIVNVGGTLIVTKLEMFRNFDAFPQDAVIKQYGRVLKLRPVGNRAVPSSTV
jgi:hypothetical protein